MRLIMLIPIFILMGVSGYNLTGGYAPQTNDAQTVAPEMLHMAVILVCVAAISYIVRSVFVIKYTQTEVPEKTPRLYQRLAQQLHL